MLILTISLTVLVAWLLIVVVFQRGMLCEIDGRAAKLRGELSIQTDLRWEQAKRIKALEESVKAQEALIASLEAQRDAAEALSSRLHAAFNALIQAVDKAEEQVERERDVEKEAA